MVHTFRGKNLKYWRTTWMKGVEYDVYTMPDGTVVSFLSGTNVPDRVWENKKDFEFTNMIKNL
jgi:hypothetical protein